MMASGTMIQPPSHVTFPAVANWFQIDEIHEIEKYHFPEFFVSSSEVNNRQSILQQNSKQPQSQSISQHQSQFQEKNAMIKQQHQSIKSNEDLIKQKEAQEVQEQKFDTTEQIFSFGVKNANLYMYYRNLILSMWRENGKKYLSPALCRKNLLGDVSSIMRIHGFLENWGLINFPSKQHVRGYSVKQPELLQCFVCETNSPGGQGTFYVAQVEENVLFQICYNCFINNYYPQSIRKHQFKKIMLDNHKNDNEKQMDTKQMVRMLEIVNGIPNGPPRDKDKDSWSVVQKEFPEFTRQQIIKNFLKIPLNVQMNANIFDNNQDVLTYQKEYIKKQIQNVSQPSVFEDFQNPILGSVAMGYYKWQKQKASTTNLPKKQNNQKDNVSQNPQVSAQNQFPQKDSKENLLNKIFQTIQVHAKYLANDQSQKVKNLTKMLIEVTLSKLQLKSIFVQQYNRLVRVEQDQSKLVVKNNLAEYLKQTSCFLEKQKIAQLQELQNANKEDEKKDINQQMQQENGQEILIDDQL